MSNVEPIVVNKLIYKVQFSQYNCHKTRYTFDSDYTFRSEKYRFDRTDYWSFISNEAISNKSIATAK